MTTTLMLNAGKNIVPWLENETGVAYATLRRHYARWMSGERTVQANFADVAP